jgi:hypothetical protein
VGFRVSRFVLWIAAGTISCGVGLIGFDALHISKGDEHVPVMTELLSCVYAILTVLGYITVLSSLTLALLDSFDRRKARALLVK